MTLSLLIVAVAVAVVSGTIAGVAAHYSFKRDQAKWEANRKIIMELAKK